MIEATSTILETGILKVIVIKKLGSRLLFLKLFWLITVNLIKAYEQMKFKEITEVLMTCHVITNSPIERSSFGKVLDNLILSHTFESH